MRMTGNAFSPFWRWQSISDLISAAANKGSLSPLVVRFGHVTRLNPGKRRADTDAPFLEGPGLNGGALEKGEEGKGRTLWCIANNASCVFFRLVCRLRSA